MDVIISVPGEFHAPKLAHGLSKRGLLKRYYSSHPKRYISSEVPRSKITSLWPAEVVGQIGYKAPWIESIFPSNTWNRPFFRSKQMLFDRGVSKCLDAPSDESILVGYSGSMLSSIDRGKELGYVTVVERASAHIREQQQILENAYEKHFPEGKSPISDRFVRREEQEYEQADYIIVPSTFVADTFEKHGVSTEKVVTVPLGVDPQRVPTRSLGRGSKSDRPTRVQQVVDDKPYLLFIGGVSLRKGIPYLIEGWRKADVDTHELVIIGSVDHTVQDVLDNTPADAHILGWEDDIDIWYQNADVFVFPSLEDGFARVVMESLNCGTPVIISERTGAKDQVRDGEDGLIIPAEDSQRLATAIQNGISKNWDREEISERIADLSTWEHYTNEVVSAYDKMLE